MRYARILGPAFFVLAVAGGALAMLAPVAWPGLELFGWACGGGGDEQVCRDLHRHPTLVEVDWKAWLWVAGGAVCSAIALSALVISRELWRLVAAVAIFSLAVAGVVTTTQVEVLLGPDDDISTLGRADEEWGPIYDRHCSTSGPTVFAATRDGASDPVRLPSNVNRPSSPSPCTR
jgi:hypothetical protein